MGHPTGETSNSMQQHDATYYLTLAEQARQKMFGLKRRQWLERLELEYANLQVALQWLAEHGPAEAGLRLVIGLREFWLGGSHIDVGRHWLVTFLNDQRFIIPPEVYAQALD